MKKRSEVLQSIFESMTTMQRLMHLRFERSFGKSDLSPSQMRMLALIAHIPSITSKLLADKLSLTPGAITQLTDALVRADYIERVPDKNDRRITRLSLTRKGKRKMATITKVRENMLKDAMTALDDEELQTFLDIQRKIITYFEKDNPAHITKKSTREQRAQ